jgi:uncharacterized protein
MTFIDVWIIDGGNPGHLVQSEGILDALEREGTQLRRTSILCSTRLRGAFRSPARRLMDISSGRWILQIVRMFSDFELPQSTKPSFLISSGGSSAYLSRALSLSMGVPNVFVGFPGRFPPRWFTIVMAPIELPFIGTKVIPTFITPNTITTEKCHAAATNYWKGSTPHNCWALLIGGTSPSHRYSPADWEAIVDGVHNLSHRYGVKWLITTSKRTGPETERRLVRLLDPTCVEQLTLFSSDPKKIVAPYLGAAKIVFVTQDSRTMIGEAISSGCRVAILARDKYEFNRHQVLSSEFVYSLPQVVRVNSTSMKNYRIEDHQLPKFEPEALLRRAALNLQTELRLNTLGVHFGASMPPL